jgi:phosphomannomutase
MSVRPASTNGTAPRIATHSGLRGKHLTGEDVDATAGGLVALVDREEIEGAIGLASDGRPGNDELVDGVVDAVTARGRDVVDFGVVSTPTAKIAARERGLAGAVVVTASHLPHGWSGLKLVIGPHYLPVDVGRLPPPPPPRAGSERRRLQDDAAASLHADAIERAVDADAIRELRPRVSVSGGAGDAARLTVERLGCELGGVTADFGLQLDADGDRLRLADRAGNELDEELTLALAALSVRPRLLVKGADTSRMIDDIVASAGGEVRTVTPGELHLVEALIETGGQLAGEGNGGVAFPAVAMARDGLTAAALILQLLAQRREPLEEIAKALPSYARRRSRVPCEHEADARAAVEAVAAEHGLGPADPEVGVQLELGDGAWAMLRRSATEPVLRVTVEAPDEATAEALHKRLLDGISRALAG